MPAPTSRRTANHRFLGFLAVGWLVTLGRMHAIAAEAPSRPLPLAGADLFTNGAVQTFQLRLGPAEKAALAASPKDFVRATVVAGGQVWGDVGVHLKGSTGSFRTVDDKPSWTLDFARFYPGRTFHGLRRLHLNNSVEDPSYLNERLGSDLFRTAGIPAPRVGHATVTLNGRRLGLYVLKEGFTEDLLKGYFSRISGDLYEPIEGGDVDSVMKRGSVEAPATGGRALEALVEAARESDPQRRWDRLDHVLDSKQFLTFMALEIVLCHRDGYCLARNNYRVYQDLDSNRILFFPAGMDQLLGPPDFPWQPRMAGLIARAVLETPEGKLRYRETLGTTLTNLLQLDRINSNLDDLVRGLRPGVPGAGWNRLKSEAELVKDHLRQRYSWLQSQLREQGPSPVEFSAGAAQLQGWHSADASSMATLDRTILPDGTPALHIAARGDTSASWRTTVLLGPGRYCFVGRTRVEGVQPLPFGKHHGATLRTVGDVRKVDGVTGTAPWREISFEFEVGADSQAVEFVCELRAKAGEAWYDLNSLRVLQKP